MFTNSIIFSKIKPAGALMEFTEQHLYR